MQILYRRHTLHDDRTRAKQVLLAGFKGYEYSELQGIPQFRNAQIKLKRASQQAESSNQTTALARIDLQLSEEQGNLKFRHLLFVVFCLATFRAKTEIPSLFETAFPGRTITPQTIAAAERWMRRLDVDPDLQLKGKDKRWKELWLQFCEQRRDYLGTIKDIPLVHPRKRIEALVDLFQEVQPVPDKVLLMPEPVLDLETGAQKIDNKGRRLFFDRPILVHKKDFGAALQCLKQIGVESGTYVEKTETQLTFRELIQRRRRERGFRDNITDAKVLGETFVTEAAANADAEMPDVELRLPYPTQVPEGVFEDA